MTDTDISGTHVNFTNERLVLLLAAGSAILFASLAWYIVAYGHPHEDAYILFIYSESLADFGKISFYDAGPNAEGATDFLWMALIALQNYLGIPSFVASSLLNMIGCFGISYLIIKECSKHGYWLPVGILIALFVPIYSISQASLGGFSSNLYAAASLLLFFALFRGSADKLLWVPFLGITIGLFRPDGVILGVIATCIAICLIERSYRARFIRNALIAAVIGVVYFSWRWWYFGHFFPLPIYVKGDSGSRLAGLADNISWIQLNFLLLLGVGISLFSPHMNKLRYLIAAVPAVTLVAVFTLFHQSQNLAYRFHSPASALLLLGTAIGMVVLIEKAKHSRLPLKLAMISVLVFYAGYHFTKHIRLTDALVAELTTADYINYFPYLLREDISSDTKIALTEAGRFAYWLDGEKFDLVGLNTAETAKLGASPEYLETLAPDLVFFHVAGTLKYTCEDSKMWCEVQGPELVNLLEQRKPRDYFKTKNRVRRAPLAAYQFFSDNAGDYRIFFVQETIDERRADFRHVYGIKIDGPVDIPSFLDALSASFDPSNRMSYLEMECDRGTRRFMCGFLTSPKE